MAKRGTRSSTRQVLEELIDRPPLNDGELGRRLRGVDRADARREIVDRLFDGSAPRDALDLLAAALLHLGIEGQEARLERIVADVRRSLGERWTALSLVFSAAPERANRALTGLSPEDGLRLTLQPAAEAVADVLTEPAAGDTVAEALAALPREVRGEAWAYLEEVRRSAGAPAVLAYRELLERDGLDDLRRLALDAVVEEGGAAAAAELARLRDEASDATSQKAFQRALLRLSTRAIEAPSPASSVKGRGHLGICDGQGAFVLLGCFDNADGTTSIADLCIRASGEVRDGFAAAGLDEHEVGSLFDRMREGGIGDLAPLSLPDAAALAFAGVERTRTAGLTLPEDARSALLLFERARGAAEPASIPAPDRGPVTVAEARSLLSLPCYESWFFDKGDLAGASVDLPAARPKKPRSGWIEGALAKLEGSEVAPRLTAMLTHMARWHALRGEADRAALCAAASGEAKRSFRSCSVPRVMLERSVDILRAEAGSRIGVVGDPESRDRIRVQLFLDVNDPKGKDLAALDLTEAALFALTDALETFPGSRRPREDDLLHAAGALAALFVRWMLSRRKGQPGGLIGEMEEALAGLGSLGPGERAALVGQVLPALATFVGEVCESCPVACLTRPKADVADAFFSERHPAFG